jgi:hypothetical protein
LKLGSFSDRLQGSPCFLALRYLCRRRFIPALLLLILKSLFSLSDLSKIWEVVQGKFWRAGIAGTIRDRIDCLIARIMIAQANKLRSWAHDKHFGTAGHGNKKELDLI